MTEQQWLRCKDPKQMLDFLGNPASERQLRLFAVAYCRTQTSPLYQERSERLMVLAERYADGQAKRIELKRARKMAYPMGLISTIEAEAAESASLVIIQASSQPQERSRQAALLLDIFGNPFKPLSVDPSWLSWNKGTIQKIAQSIYDERRFEDLPILADALEEAGCIAEPILEHCRGPGPHVRGCWAVDLLLAKK